MAFVKADRVQEESSTIGSGPFVLTGVYNTSYRTFASQMEDGDTCQVLILNEAAPNEWVIAESAFQAPATITISTILSSSSDDGPVFFSSGRKRVAMLPPASAMVVEDNEGNSSIANNLSIGGVLAVVGDITFNNGTPVSSIVTEAEAFATAAGISAAEAADSADIATTAAAGALNQEFLTDDWPGFVAPYVGPNVALVGSDFRLVWTAQTTNEDIEELRQGTSTIFLDDWPGYGRNGPWNLDAECRVVGEAPPQGGLSQATQIAAQYDSSTTIQVPMRITSYGDTIWLYIVFGQSLTLGGGVINPVVYTDQTTASGMGWYPYCWMPSVGVVPYGADWSSMINAYEQLFSIGINPSGETGWVRMLGRLHDRAYAATGKHIHQAVITQGVQGQTLQELGPGTFNGETLKFNIQRAVAWAASIGKRISVRGFVQVHGNANASNTQTLRYQLMCSRFLDIWNEEIPRLTGQEDKIMLFMRQDSVASANFMTELGQSQAQLGLAVSDERVCLVGGGTQTDNQDGTHKSNINYLWEGELIAEDIADHLFMGGMVTPAVNNCWQSGTNTFDFDIGAQYPLNINTTGSVIGLVGIQGYLGCEFTDGSVSPPTITDFSVLNTTTTAPQRTIMRATLSGAPTGPASGYCFGLGMRQNANVGDGGGFQAEGYAVVSGGSITNIVITNPGNGWNNGNQIAIGGAGTGATATSVVSGGQVVGYTGLVAGSGYGGTQTYAAFLRSGAGAHVGARHCFEIQRNAYSSIGWDGLEAVTPSNPSPATPTQNPRLLNPYLARQFVRPGSPINSTVPRSS